jgi:acetyl-CoA carboxylase carboxyltransferase component
MSSLFVTGASVTVPIVAIVLRKGYGLGAMAMTGGGFAAPVYTATWPTGEFGGMGLEGAVRLGYKKELEAVEDETEREALFEKLLARMYEKGKATEAATHLEIDAVIDPADTREVILKALASAPKAKSSHDKRRTFIDTW